jgi:nitroimidazol reductase NimA-like FMN-containing flavoprotein (pyridoxamine 5'-phosphate oxidase superfamily)
MGGGKIFDRDDVGGEVLTNHATIKHLDESECLSLISGGGVGRLAYVGRFGVTVLPVNYKFYEGNIVFRTAHGSPMDEDLRTRITGAEHKVAFEIDQIDMVAREGWSVLVQGSAHHVESEAECASLAGANLEAWPSGEREHFLSIAPGRVTGRAITRTG